MDRYHLTRQRVYYAAKEYIRVKRYSPTVRELCELTGLASTSSVHSHLRKLKEMGCIDYDASCPRTLVILKDPKEEKNDLSLQCMPV